MPMHTINMNDYLTIEAAAKEARCSIDGVRRWIRKLKKVQKIPDGYNIIRSSKKKNAQYFIRRGYLQENLPLTKIPTRPPQTPPMNAGGRTVEGTAVFKPHDTRSQDKEKTPEYLETTLKWMMDKIDKQEKHIEMLSSEKEALIMQNQTLLLTGGSSNTTEERRGVLIPEKEQEQDIPEKPRKNWLSQLFSTA